MASPSALAIHDVAGGVRRVTAATTLAGIAAMALTFVTKTGPQFSRAIIAGGWLISLGALPLSRAIVRRLLTAAGLGGPRAIVLGAGTPGKQVIRSLLSQRPPSLRPIAIFDDDPALHGKILEGVPVLGSLSQAANWASKQGVRAAIIAMPGMRSESLLQIIDRHGRHFVQLLIVPDLSGLSTADTHARDVGGLLALEMRKNLLLAHNRVIKRIMDLLLTLMTAAFTLPVLTIISLAIWLESGRPIFYGHLRVGRDRREFVAWKFRTMVKNANEVLQEHLHRNPELRAEWDANQKLRNDPRLTRVGRILRRLSLDEFPQLWNVLRGEMSIVGPRPMRPIVQEEIAKYGESFSLYTQVLPGLTGLWQVSGRSEVSYEERVGMDTYYVRNWSLWLDFIILGKTFWAVLGGRGAY